MAQTSAPSARLMRLRYVTAKFSTLTALNGLRATAFLASRMACWIS